MWTQAFPDGDRSFKDALDAAANRADDADDPDLPTARRKIQTARISTGGRLPVANMSGV